MYVGITGRDIGGYVADAQRAVAERVTMPPGYTLVWSGQSESMQRAAEKLRLVIPVTLAIIFLLLYLNFKSVGEALIVMLSVPFALVGDIWFIWLLGYNWSVAVAIGFIALAGVAAETGVVMLIYLDHAWKARTDAGRQSLRDLYAAVGEPMVGGMLSSTILTLLVIPTIYSLWRQRELMTQDESAREAGRPVPISAAEVGVGA